MDAKTFLMLSILVTAGLLLQILGCALFNSWWPMLACFAYILVPMPYLFFNSRGSYDAFGDNHMQSWWVDIGKFMTGFSAIGLVAIPAVLNHAGLIVTGALLMELAAALLLLVAVVLYDFQSSKEYY